jgi:hypothetical protein
VTSENLLDESLLVIHYQHPSVFVAQFVASSLHSRFAPIVTEVFVWSVDYGMMTGIKPPIEQRDHYQWQNFLAWVI